MIKNPFNKSIVQYYALGFGKLYRFGAINIHAISQLISYIQYHNYGILLLMTVNNVYKLELNIIFVRREKQK